MIIKQFLEAVNTATEYNNTDYFTSLCEDHAKYVGSYEDLGILLENDTILSEWSKRLAFSNAQKITIDDNTDKGKFITNQLEKHKEAIINSCMLSVMLGINAFEVVYTSKDGAILIENIKNHESILAKVNEKGMAEINEYVINNFNDEYLEHKLFIVNNKPTNRYKTGYPLLVSLLEPWFLLTNLWLSWAKFMERFGLPNLYGKVPYSINPETGRNSVDTLADSLHALRNAGSAAFSNDTEVNILEAVGNGEVFAKAEERINKRIQKIITGQTLTSDQGSVGTQALGTIHLKVFRSIINSDLSIIEPQMQKISNALYFANYGEMSKYPKLTIERLEQTEGEQIERDKGLYSLGVRFNDEYIQAVYGVDVSNFTIDNGGQQQLFSASGKGTRNQFKRKTKNDIEKSEAKRDIINQAMLEQKEKASNALLEAVKASKNKSDLKKNLVKFMKGRNSPKKELADNTAKLAAAAIVNGYIQGGNHE